METMILNPERSIADAYGVLFRNLSDACRAMLLERLSKHERKHPAGKGFALSYGGWEGRNQTCDEIKAEIKGSRQFVRNEQIFD